MEPGGGAGSRERFLSLVQKLREEVKAGVGFAGQTLPGPDVSCLAQGAETGSPGAITGLWGPRFCRGGHARAFRRGSSYVEAQRWRPAVWAATDGRAVAPPLSLALHGAWTRSVDVAGKVADS